VAIAAERSEKPLSIRLSGSVDISEAAELKRLLLETLDSEMGLYMDVSALESIDVTVVQLLWAAKCQAMTAGRQFRIDGPLNPEIESRLQQAGIAMSNVLAIPLQETGSASGLEH
jgi:anti-anti-sigma factor